MKTLTREQFRLATEPTTAEFLALSREWIGKQTRDGIVEHVTWIPYNRRTGSGGVMVTVNGVRRLQNIGITNYMVG